MTSTTEDTFRDLLPITNDPLGYRTIGDILRNLRLNLRVAKKRKTSIIANDLILSVLQLRTVRV